MGDDAFGQWQLRGHQKCRPIDAMEAHYFFADHVYVGWPICCELLLFLLIRGAKADGRAVVAESIEPYVHNMIGIAGDGHSPFEGAATDGKISQTAAHERHYFIAARLRTNEARILLIMLQ